MKKRNNLQFAIYNLQFAIFFLILLSPSPVLAHSMEVFATVEGKTIQGRANFHDGTPARNADVKAFDPAGEEIGRTKTDEQGKFSLEARFRCDHRLLVDTNDGHGVEYTILAKSLPADLPSRGRSDATADQVHADAGVDQEHTQESALLKDIHDDVDALQDQLHRCQYSMQAQLDQYEHRIRFRDILGGIGFIVGLAGAAYGFYYRGLLRESQRPRE